MKKPQDIPSSKETWVNRCSPFNTQNERAQAEAELLSISKDTVMTTVLDLCGLWGGQRHPRNWVRRVAMTKAALEKKVSICTIVY